MNSKDKILNSLKAANAENFPRPDLSRLEKNAIKYDDTFAQFCEAVKTAGGSVVDAGKNLSDTIAALFPESDRIASTLPECKGFNPDEAATAGELNGTDVAVVKGEFGVAENGAVWIEQRFKHRSLLFISEALVIVLDKKNIVNNMHEAYLRLGETPSGYGIFISGPSKTADIEQALVFGAHGARKLVVAITNS